MRSPAAHILETALALQRAPGERFRLRERPLPPGVIHLIEVAAASPAALQSAAEELGEPEPVVRDAARFYLEQVLFADPDADAYRVLGLAPDVPHETIRAHHRWLQRWLHPDRAQAGDASVFATRVNQAFAQLRTPEARHAYDVRLAEARLAGASATLAPEAVRRWEHEDEAPRYGRRSRWLLAVALACCAVLAVLIVRNPERQAPWEGDEAGIAGSAGDGADAADTPAIEDRDLGILNQALLAAPAAASDELPASHDAVGQEMAAAGALPGAATDGPAVVAAAPVPARSAPPIAARAAPGVASPRRAPATAPLVAAAFVPATTSAPRPAVVPASAPPPPAAAPSAAALAAASAAAPPAAAMATPASATAPAPASPQAPAMAPAQPFEPAVALARLKLAQRRVDEVVGYLGQRPNAAPLWNAPAAQADADRLRLSLNARPGSLKVSNPSWQVGADRASLDAAYRCRPAASGPCEGRVAVDLVWREGLWLVRGIRLVPAA